LSLPALDTVELAEITAATAADGDTEGLLKVQYERGVWQLGADGPIARLHAGVQAPVVDYDGGRRRG